MTGGARCTILMSALEGEATGMRIGFIGGGNMGEAMLSAVLAAGLATSDQVTVSDVSRERQEYLAERFGVTVTDDNRRAAAGSDIIVLAVKPQNLAEAMAGLNGSLRPAQLVLSIVAGTRIESIQRGLGHAAVVRSMPNTPAQIGQGMTVWTSAAEVSAEQRQSAGAVLGAMGREIAVGDEDNVDKATAVSGSGPAYLFLFIEALTGAAVEIGISPEVAQELVLTTVLGAGRLVEQSGRDPAELRRMVTSPGGTTAAALSELAEGKFSELMTRAVRAAYRRARELGSG